MCRRYQFFGSIAFSFGLGFLIGMWVNGGFLAHCFGITMILIGLYLWQKK